MPSSNELPALEVFRMIKAPYDGPNLVFPRQAHKTRSRGKDVGLYLLGTVSGPADDFQVSLGKVQYALLQYGELRIILDFAVSIGLARLF